MVLVTLPSVIKIGSYVNIVQILLKPLIGDELFLEIFKNSAYIFWLMFESKLSFCLHP